MANEIAQSMSQDGKLSRPESGQVLPSASSLLQVFDENLAHGEAISPSGSTDFDKLGFMLVPALVSSPLRSALYRYALARAQSKTMRTDNQVPDTPSAYADPVMEELLERLTIRVEHLTGMAVSPTYSYFRVYKQSDVLRRHLDRPSCEISLTLSLGYRAETDWPLWLQTSIGQIPIHLRPGDALLYRGTEVEHWREPLRGEHVAQVFLHYVNKNGPYSHFLFDKRHGLSGLTKHKLGPRLFGLLQGFFAMQD